MKRFLRFGQRSTSSNAKGAGRTVRNSALTLPSSRFLILAALAVGLMFALFPSAGFGTATPTITSDQPDYAPGATVTLTGTNWDTGGSTVHVFVNDSTGNSWSHSADVTPSANGAIQDVFQLPDSFVATYSVAATQTTASGTLSATSSFTDTNVSLDQCGNGSSLSSATDCSSKVNSVGGWQNGELNSGNSHYREGDSVPFRLIFTGLAQNSTNSVTIRWQTLNAGSGGNPDQHAYDYLTTWKRTVVNSDPCSTTNAPNGFTGCTVNSPDSTFAIPADPSATALCGDLHPPTSSTGDFKMWGGTITTAAPYGLSGCSPAGTNADNSLHIVFTTGNSTQVVLAWGGHIASAIDWGQGESAGAISGSPYHMFVNNADCDPFNCGNQDRALQASGGILPEPGISTQVSPTSITLGGSFTDTATLTGSPTPTGSVAFFVCGPGGVTPCTSGGSQIGGVGMSYPVNSGAATSGSFQPGSTGTYCVRAEYTPDANAPYSPTVSSVTTNECVTVVAKLNPTVATTIHSGSTDGATPVAVTDAPIGSHVHDSVSVSGSQGTPGGTVTFKVWRGRTTCPADQTANPPDATEGPDTLSSGGFDPALAQQVPVGGLAYMAHYSGDSTYTAGDSPCESLTADQLTPTVATTIHSGSTDGATPVAVTDAPIGSHVHDSVSVSGSQGTPGGTVTFKVWRGRTTCPADQTANPPDATEGPDTLSSGGFDPALAQQVPVGGLAYMAHYSGDSTYTAGDSPCESLTADQLTPTVATTIHSGSTDGATPVAVTDAPIGSHVHDSVSVSGSQGTPGGTVTFKVWRGRTTCPADQTANPPDATEGPDTLSSGGFDPALAQQVPVGGLAYMAHYSGDSTYTAGDSPCESLTADQLTPTVATTIHSGSTDGATPVAVTDAPIGSHVHDSVSVSGSQGTPGGTVTFKVWRGRTTCPADQTANPPDATEGPDTLSSGGFDPALAQQVPVGGLAYMAHYSGDSTYTAGDSPCESLTADQLTPTVATTIHSGSTDGATPVAVTDAPIGSHVHDSVSVSGSQGTPGGTVTFKVWRGRTTCPADQTANPPDATEGPDTLSSGGFDPALAQQVPVGGLAYMAHYSGDSTYTAGDSPCESLTADQLTPTVATTIHSGSTDGATPVAVTDAPIGSHVHDSVSVSGSQGTPGGTVTFKVWRGRTTCPADQTANPPDATEGPDTLSSGGFDPALAQQVPVGGLAYMAHYSGDSTYTAGDSPCESLTADQLTPTVATTIHSGSTDGATPVAVTDAPIGSHVHDSVSVSGSQGTPGGTVTFKVWRGRTTCPADQTANPPDATEGPDTLSSGGFDPALAQQVPVGGLAYMAHYSGDSTYTAGDSPCEPLTADKLSSSTSTTIHSGSADGATPVPVTVAPVGSTVHDSAQVTGSTVGGTPTGTVDFKVWLGSTACSGTPSDTKTGVALVNGVADPALAKTVPTGGLAYQAHYNGDSTYNPSDGACEVLLPQSLLTDTQLCTFDVDNTTAGSQMRLIYTPDPASAYWKLNGSNPGQFYYNVFSNSGPTSLTITLPYPWVTQGNVPIHAYSNVTMTTVNGQTCLLPGTEVSNSSKQVTLSSYSSQTIGTTNTTTVTLTGLPAGWKYLNIHLDYGLKGTGGYAKGTEATNGCPSGTNDALQGGTSTVLIPDCQPYAFSDTTGGSSQIKSENVFKKDPGIGGLIRNGTGDPKQNVQVNIYSGLKASGTPLATVYTDADGWYMWQYKYTGKAASFTVSVPAYKLTQTVTLKSNGFLVVNFTTP